MAGGLGRFLVPVEHQHGGALVLVPSSGVILNASGRVRVPQAARVPHPPPPANFLCRRVTGGPERRNKCVTPRGNGLS
jgi:hypothetical protein